MSIQAPPTLLDVVLQILLRNEALTFSFLEYLPKELFPPLFKKAFTSKQTNILRAVVQAWPFPCLPLGSLMKTPDLEILQAVLDGVDMLIAQKEKPRRCKLQVLELLNKHRNFWNIWVGTTKGNCYPRVISKTPTVEDRAVPGGKKQPLKVLVDFCLKCPDLDEYQKYFFQWAEQRKSLLQLCCQKLQIWEKPVCSVLRLLKSLEPGYIQELEVSTLWRLRSLPLTLFTPDTEYMRNRSRTNEGVELIECMYTALEERIVTTVISQLPKFSSLQHLCLKEVHFFKVSLDQVLRSLRSSLETLAITHCHLSQSDLNCLSKYPSIYQLKHLNLSGSKIFHLCARPLKVLLERVSATLQTLELDDCRMEDSQIKALLPALSQCSQLTKVNFYGNYISTSVLKNLLQHTASLSQLSLELYPAPFECYDVMGGFLVERFTQLGPELMDTLWAVRKPKIVCFASNVCLKCYERCVYIQDVCLCSCWQ
ncbi:PRAME family member 12-like [Nannospalax galili]|uniref:PRAME family member 12-like n=1 Tax=Nannospalax galili TaxID=1026970 RepID=UPI0004ED29E0|nr:PRAME family member 12-like [Nannospalax galili]